MYFHLNCRTFFSLQSSNVSGISTVGIKNHASFNSAAFTQLCFFYFLCFQRFLQGSSMTSSQLVLLARNSTDVFIVNSFFIGVVAFSFANLSKARFIKDSTFLSGSRDSLSRALRSSFVTRISFIKSPLLFFSIVSEELVQLLSPAGFNPSACFAGLFLFLANASFSRGVAIRLFLLNFHCFWDIFFIGLCSLHRFFFYKVHAFLALFYPIESLSSAASSAAFWRYFFTFLFLGMPRRICSRRSISANFESILAFSFLRTVGHLCLVQFNFVIHSVFSSNSFFVFHFLKAFNVPVHFQWLLTAFRNRYKIRVARRKASSRKLSMFKARGPINFFQSAVFQLLYSIHTRGLKARAFNFIFSFLMLLSFEKAENFEVFMQESLVSYVLTDSFFNLRLPFQVYNTKLRGKSTQLPVLLQRTKSMTLAFKLFIMCVKKRNENGFLSKIFSEFFDLVNGNGLSLKQKAVTVRLAFSNKNLLFFRATRFAFGQQRRKKTIIL